MGKEVWGIEIFVITGEELKNRKRYRKKRERGEKETEKGSIGEGKAERFRREVRRPFTFGDECMHIIMYSMLSYLLRTCL